MQSNQPFGMYGFQNFPTTVLENLQIVGEGDVKVITLSDGSVQFYFIPTYRHEYLPYRLNMKVPGSNYSWPSFTEVWFVRSIIHPQANINLSAPTSQPTYQFGEYFLTPPTSTCPEYLQKFHNDKWTSTTDIHYFYPCLRRSKHLQYCTETQTSVPFQKSRYWKNVDSSKSCHCKYRSGLREKQTILNEYACDLASINSNVSCMSVDTERNVSEQRPSKKYKNKPAKRNETYINDNICKCKVKIKATSDKLVTTYADQATENFAEDGAQTHTKRMTSKTSYNYTDIWPAIKQNVSKSNSTLKMDGQRDTCNSGSCTCSSTSVTASD